MATQQTILVDGKPYVLLPREEYERLTTLAKVAELPPLPEPDADGNYPAVEYARASLARDIIRDRVALGWSQRELASQSGVRVETLCRLETGKVTPSLATVKKIDLALKHAGKQQRAGKPNTKRTSKRRK
ncbi:MAG TPA: helix-turn-helix domain-containing protein [Pirellulales bacterium]